MGKLPGNERAVAHLLNRFTFGPRPEDVERVRRIGLERYLEEQLGPEAIPDPRTEERLTGLQTLSLSSGELLERFPPGNRKKRMMTGGRPPRHIILELQEAKLLRAVYSERQLYEVMVDFWTNHFNVFAAKAADRWLITSYDRDVIRPHALGRFRDLLLATAQSPAMLFYLDNWLSVGEEAGRRIQRRRRRRGVDRPTSRRGLNENYARELLELHTLGVDGGYTQKDVEEVARCFTGWTLRRPWSDARFRFEPGLHDRGEKGVLGVRLPPGGGIEDGLRVIDLLAHHPSTARFIAAKLARRFVRDDPPPSLVGRVAEVFRRTGGEIRPVLRAIAASPEFFSDAAYRAKIKKPLEFTASALRALHVEIDRGLPLLRLLARMGEPPFLCRPPTGYPDTAHSWISSGALLGRINFAIRVTANRMPGCRIDRMLASKGPDELVNLLVSGEASGPTREVLSRLHLFGKRKKGARGAAILLASPEFQRR